MLVPLDLRQKCALSLQNPSQAESPALKGHCIIFFLLHQDLKHKSKLQPTVLKLSGKNAKGLHMSSTAPSAHRVPGKYSKQSRCLSALFSPFSLLPDCKEAVKLSGT